MVNVSRSFPGRNSMPCTVFVNDAHSATITAEIGRAHVPPVTNAHLVCRLLLENKPAEQVAAPEIADRRTKANPSELPSPSREKNEQISMTNTTTSTAI